LQILAIAWAMAVVCALQPIPNRGAGIRGDLFSVAIEWVFQDARPSQPLLDASEAAGIRVKLGA
jgi:hypothetical protein